MQVWIVADDVSLAEWPLQSAGNDVIFKIVTTINQIHLTENDSVVVDLLFDNSADRINALVNLKFVLVIVNLVTGDLQKLPAHFIRINAWPGFLQRPLTEASTLNERNKVVANKVIEATGKKVEWVPDVPGFFTARIISCIINEAFLALQEEISTREEIDTAMKMGTNYPYGPFEWADKIGIGRVAALLQLLSGNEPRYRPAALLLQTAYTK